MSILVNKQTSLEFYLHYFFFGFLAVLLSFAQLYNRKNTNIKMYIMNCYVFFSRSCRGKQLYTNFSLNKSDESFRIWDFHVEFSTIISQLAI